MASFVSMGAYDATVAYPSFRGLMQHGDGINGDTRYAVEAENVETPGGVLQPCARCQLLPPALTEPIETLALLHRRWHVSDNEKDLLIAASSGRLYAALPTATEWTELTPPEGVELYQSNVWSWVTYEINEDGSDAPVDVLLLSNAQDGMVMVRGDNLAVTTVPTPKRFGVITRYAERIWGGAITDDPDMLVYSAPYDPTDWSANVDIPEDGAGDIMQPSWDGDSFTALHPFGSQLIAFKRTRVWRILGTDPGEYVFKEQFGGGAPHEATIAVDTERIFMLTDQGVDVYDGLSVSPFQQELAKNVFRRMNKSALAQASACLWRGSYYCAIPIDGSLYNNAVLIYNSVDNTWLLRTDLCVERFLPAEDSLFYTTSTAPGCVGRWCNDSWLEDSVTESAVTWVSPWSDLGRKDIVKGSFEVYLLAEVKSVPVTLTVSLETEKKVKRKAYVVMPATGKLHKVKRLHFGGSGRRFRLSISAPARSAPWRLTGGITVVAEIDPD